MYLTTFTFAFLCLTKYEVAVGRKVAALDDICARGAYAFCNNAPKQAASASRDLPQPQQSPNNAPLGTPPPLPTVGEYCAKFQEHYSYYCTGTNAKDPKANDFCPTYISHCDVSATQAASAPQAPTPQPELPPEKIQQICSEYQSIANQYCFRPQIPKAWSVKKNCDVYLRYCVGTAREQNSNTNMSQVIRDNLKPCRDHQNDYIGYCVQNKVPYNANTAEFCKNYKATCVPVKMQMPTDGVDMAQIQPQPQMQQMQPVPVQAQAPTGAGTGTFGGNPWAGAGSPMSPVGTPMALGNPNTITDPLGSLGGNSGTVTNPLGSLGGGGPMANPASSMINQMQGAPPMQGMPIDSAGNVPSGMAAHPLAVGSQTSVGQMAGVARGTSVNPFGQVATGTTVNGGPVGVQTGQAVDFSGIPGLSQLGSIPGLGRRRRKRNLSLLMWVLQR